MKKLISAFLSASVMLSACTAFAGTVEKINYDFDENTLGGWGNAAGCSTVKYPEGTENNCVALPSGSISQITHTPGIANSYYGKTIYSGDFYPMEEKLNVNIFLRFFGVDATSSTNTYVGGSSSIAIDGSGTIKVAERSITVGKCSVGTKYSYIIVNDQASHKYDVYLNGIWNGEEHPGTETESAEYPGYELAGTYNYPETWGPVGAWYVYNNTGTLYADNLHMEAPDAAFTTSGFAEGDSAITFYADQYMDTDTIGDLVLTRVGAESTALEYGTDYTVAWETAMANFPRGAGLTINFAEPVGEGEQIIFDFSAVKDSYGRTLEGLNIALPTNPDSEAINAAYADFSANWLTETRVKAMTTDAPEYITPIDGGSTVSVDYAVSGEDSTVSELVTIADGQLTIKQPEVDDMNVPLSSYDKQAEIVVTMSCGNQPVKTITRNFSIVRRKLLDEAAEEDERVKALADDDEETVWTPEGGSGELTVSFAEARAIGGVVADGTYGDIRYSVSDNGADFTEIAQYPIKARYFRVTVSGTEEEPASLKALEPVTSSFYEDVIARAEDLTNLVYSENLTNLTSDKYLTLPKTTANGTPVSWSSSNRNVIDEYGTVTQTSRRETVTLTARAVDSKGNVIETASVDFTATVAAKTAAAGSSGGGGGGGGGGTSPQKPINVSPVVPKPTVEPYESPLPTETPKPKPPVFDDMKNVPWAAEAVTALTEDGIIDGKGDRVFAPNDNITREEFVKLIVTAFDIKGNDSIPEFADVPSGAWYAEYIIAAYSAGIVSGISDTEFGVGTDVTRQDIAVILKRTADYKQLTTEINTDLPELSDIDSTSVYAIEAVRLMLSSGVINGSGGRLSPTDNATRAEAAVMMYRFINNFN